MDVIQAPTREYPLCSWEVTSWLILESPVFRDTENRRKKNHENSGRTQNSQNFTENKIFDGKKKSKDGKYSLRRHKNKAKNQWNRTLYAPNIWIKPVRSVYTCFSCPVFTVYNCSVICFVHISEDHRIWSLEHRRTQIWQFRTTENWGLYHRHRHRWLCIVSEGCSIVSSPH